MPVLTITEIKEMVRANIERALARCNGRVYGKDGAAALLGMKPTTLWSRLRSLGISTEKEVSRVNSRVVSAVGRLPLGEPPQPASLSPPIPSGGGRGERIQQTTPY
jgi:hypothetical protein